MYTLRSRASYAKAEEKAAELTQTTIPFRKRRRPATQSTKAQEKLTTPEEENITTLSPPKRTKQEAMPITRSVTSASKKVLGRRTLRPRVERIPTSPAAVRSRTATPSAKQPHPSSPQKKACPLTPLRSPLKDRNTIVNDVTGSPKTPKNEGEATKDDQATPTQTPCSAARSVMKRLDFSTSSSLNDVKRSLHNSLPSHLHCRDSQLTTLSSHITSHLTKKTPGSLYISGAPGTGKTACLTHILNNPSNSDLFRETSIVSVNCMSVKRPQAIYSMIASELLGKAALKLRSVSALQEALVKHITSTKKMIIILLDEIDQLDSRGQEVLYTIFEWPALKSSKLLLIGIANALDLTDRILPRLQSHAKCRPTLIHFPPYNKDEIALILKHRLDGENTNTVIDPMAVQFAARKVAAVHGDLRKALDICRRAVELVETEHLTAKPQATPTTPAAPLKVTLRHIAAVISEVYSSSITSQSSKQTLPLQQKIVVCVLLCLLRGKVKEVTIGKLHEAYVRVCRYRQLKAESESEFVGVCGMLETRGIVGVKKAKETRMMKVTLKLNESDLEHAVQDKVLLSSILEHGIPSSC